MYALKKATDKLHLAQEYTYKKTYRVEVLFLS